jgi:hypothetical protein
MKTRTYATPTQDDPLRKAVKKHRSDTHTATAEAAPQAGTTRVLAMQHAMGNAATQRAMGDHVHGRDCSCLACKPRINQAMMRPDKATTRPQAGSPTSTTDTNTNTPTSATSYMADGEVQRWWDDDENDSSSSGSSSSGGSIWSSLNPFSSDDQNNSSASGGSGGSNVATGEIQPQDYGGSTGGWYNQNTSANNQQGGDSGGDDSSWWGKLNPFGGDKKDDEGGGGNSGDDGSWWGKLNPFGGDKKDGDEGGGWSPFGDWNPFKDFNPFGGFQPLGDLPETPPDWWPSDWWPGGGGAGGQKDDQGGDPAAADRNPMPVGDSLKDSPDYKAAHTVGCMVGDEAAPALPPETTPATQAPQPQSNGMVRLRLNPQLNTSNSVRENLGEASQHPLAAMKATSNASVGTASSTKRNDGFVGTTSQYGVTDGTYSLTGQSWHYDDNANTMNINATLSQSIVWGINNGKEISITGADDPQIAEGNFEEVAQSMEHFANRTGAPGESGSPAYWMPSLAVAHELVHVKQLEDRITKEAPILASRIGALVIDVPSWWFWTQAESGWTPKERGSVSIQLENAIIAPGGIMENFARETSKNYAAGCEAPAYAAGKGEFQKVADQIRARAKREKWV